METFIYYDTIRNHAIKVGTKSLQRSTFSCAVVFVCRASSITEADERYLKETGKDIRKQTSIVVTSPNWMKSEIWDLGTLACMIKCVEEHEGDLDERG